MNQGDVYWFTFRAPDRRRPVLILTRDSAIVFLTSVTVAPITSTIRNSPSEVALTTADGMPYDCAANLDNIQTIPKAQLGAFISQLSPPRMRDVRAAITFALGLEELT